MSVACEMTHDPGDRDGRSPMALQAKDVLGRGFDAVADVGDYHGPEVKACREAGITPSGSRPITSANGRLGLFSTDDCTDDTPMETSQGPAGARLPCRVDTVALGRPSRYDATAACTGGVRKQQGPRHNGGRRITRGVDEALLEEMEPRVRRRPEVMKRRQELVEHQFGTMQRGWDQSYFLMRGLEHVRTECSLRSWLTISGGGCPASGGLGGEPRSAETCLLAAWSCGQRLLKERSTRTAECQ
jgi:hypothetical protein